MGILDRVNRSPLISFELPVGEMTLRVQSADDLQDEARAVAIKYSEQVESYVVRNPSFKTSFVSLPVGQDAPDLVKVMGDASAHLGVGPMVTLPGALVEAVATDLAAMTKEVSVSAEGDTYSIGSRPRVYVVEPAKGGGGIGVKVKSKTGYAFYTSAGRMRVNPAIGKARSVGVLAEHGALADAVGSAMGLSMHRPDEVERALEVCKATEGVRGAVIVAGGRIGVWGELEIITPTST